MVTCRVSVLSLAWVHPMEMVRARGAIVKGRGCVVTCSVSVLSLAWVHPMEMARARGASRAWIDTKVLPGQGGGLITAVVAAAAVATAVTEEAKVVAAVVNIADADDDDGDGDDNVVLLLVVLLVLVSSLAGQLSGLTAKHFRNNCPNILPLPLVLSGLVKGGRVESTNPSTEP